MTSREVTELLHAVAERRMTIEEARLRLQVRRLADRSGELESNELGESGASYARLDLGREARVGQPEAVLAAGKTDRELLAIVERFVEATGRALVTRLDRERRGLLTKRFEDGRYDARGRVFSVGRRELDGARPVSVVSAGTSDLSVAEEAAVCAHWLGHQVERTYDIGVAGVHRLLSQLPRLRSAEVIIVVAGMDGALPTVVAGLVACPVIAVPTSVGYGAAFDGLAALLTMLNACAPGVAVVNIDNGFGAAVLASRILAHASQ